MTFDNRLRAICSLSVPAAREMAGRHEYDGILQDLSPDGVRRGLAALGGPHDEARPAGSAYPDPHDEARPASSAYPDPHDEAHVRAAEESLRVRFGELELHRIQPSLHLENLDPACYEREYAPAQERAEARRRHVRGWPEAIDAAIKSLIRVPIPLAEVAIADARGLAHYAQDDPAAASALDRLVEHLRTASVPEMALGGAALGRLMSAAEAIQVDLSELAKRADSERHHWLSRLDGRTSLLESGLPAADEVVPLAASLVAQAREWASDLVPYLDGECRVGPTPPTQSWQVATMTCAAPYEPDGPSWFRVTPPDPSWPEQRRLDWLRLYHPSAMANIVIHEVAPGHFAHGRARRRVGSDVRRTLVSEGFSEGWAHYTEQLALEQGFRSDDPGFEVAVARDALLRITRLTTSIGLQTGDMAFADAVHLYETDVSLPHHAAVAAANRVLRDPTTISYTWGRLSILDARERAKAKWGNDFSLARFHRSLLDLGSPPLGLLP